MPLYIKDDATSCLVAELATRLNLSKQDAVKGAVQAQLDRLAGDQTTLDRLAAFYADHPLPSKTGEAADKAFFDSLSGETA